MSDNRLLHRAYSCSEELRNEINQLCSRRSDTIRELNAIARKLHEVHKDVNISKTVGSSAGILGGLVSITGLALSPFTAGTSLALIAVGSGVAAAGGITSTGATIAEKIISREQLSKAQAALEADAAQVKKVQVRFKEFEELCKEITEILDAERQQEEEASASSEERTVWTKLKELWKTFSESKVGRAVLFIWNIISLGKSAYRAVTATWDIVQIILIGIKEFTTIKQAASPGIIARILGSTAYFIFDGIFQVIGLVIDIYTLITTIIDMKNGSKSEAALELEKKAKELEREREMWKEAFLK